MEKKYYADGEDAYSMKRELKDLITQRDLEREQRAALNKVRHTKEGKATEGKTNEGNTNEMVGLEKKIKVLDIE